MHHILANELAAVAFPSTNWLRLEVLTHNLLQLLKRAALPGEYANAHPKRLRFSVITVMGRIIGPAEIEAEAAKEKLTFRG